MTRDRKTQVYRSVAPKSESPGAFEWVVDGVKSVAAKVKKTKKKKLRCVTLGGESMRLLNVLH